MTLRVMAADNRGTAEVPFGYIYFNDNTRINYSADILNGNTVEHIELAIEYLKERFPEVKWDQ